MNQKNKARQATEEAADSLYGPASPFFYRRILHKSSTSFERWLCVREKRSIISKFIHACHRYMRRAADDARWTRLLSRLPFSIQFESVVSFELIALLVKQYRSVVRSLKSLLHLCVR